MNETISALKAERRALARRRDALMAEHIDPLDARDEALAAQIKAAYAAEVATVTDEDLRTDPRALDRLALAAANGSPDAYQRIRDLYNAICPMAGIGVGTYRFGKGDQTGVIVRPKVVDHVIDKTGLDAYLTALTTLLGLIPWREENGDPTRVAVLDVLPHDGYGIYYIEADLDTDTWTYTNAVHGREEILITGPAREVLAVIAEQYRLASDAD